ncbi:MULTISPECIES: DUF3325 domain-containing protein [Pseudomonas]|uniref:DUF3325 domain-containing protein n=1 Tax=Pseudomonas TaxID=286 RepID=UPI000C0CB6DD|nr:iron uptake protein [Pseudomonadaceae bacterium]HCP56428.1 DUF3325 domain-containing protein [Pseudomonas sp.]
MLIEFFAGLLLVYAGMVALCLGLKRHFKSVWQCEPSAIWCRSFRVCGWLLLALGFAACIASWGWAQGPVGWMGLVSLAGLALVLLMPYRPRLATLLPLLGLPFLLSAWLLA